MVDEGVRSILRTRQKNRRVVEEAIREQEGLVDGVYISTRDTGRDERKTK